MKVAHSEATLARTLPEAGLDLERLTPWPAWKVFKAFLHQEVDGVYDPASFQIIPANETEGSAAISARVGPPRRAPLPERPAL
jgi:hypothetical protein